MSARASGPIGWLVPSFMPASMSSGVARPSASTKKASLIMGTRMRLTTKPGAFFTVIGVLPRRSARAFTASCVASLVCRPRMISTSAIMGTGLKKCMPTKRSARCVAAASLVMLIELVLVATITSARQHAVELLQDLDLEGFVFGRGLDHELGALEVVVAGAALDQGQRLVLVGGGDLLFLDQPVQAAGDGGQALVDGGLLRCRP